MRKIEKQHAVGKINVGTAYQAAKGEGIRNVGDWLNKPELIQHELVEKKQPANDRCVCQRHELEDSKSDGGTDLHQVCLGMVDTIEHNRVE